MKKPVAEPHAATGIDSGPDSDNLPAPQGQALLYQVQPASTLNDVARRLAQDRKYQPSDGETKCNLFLSDFALQAFNYSGFVDHGTDISANATIDLMRTGRDNWKAVSDWKRSYLSTDLNDLQRSFVRAITLSNQGFLVVYGLRLAPHGHVAAGVTGDSKQSAKWASAGLPRNVPIVAQAGESVFAAAGLSDGIGPANFKRGEFVIYVRIEKLPP